MGKAFAAWGLVLLYICLCFLQSTSGFGIDGGSLTMGFKKVSVRSEMVSVERILCLENNGKCSLKFIVCPTECPQRKPADSKAKACFADCGSKCETSCKHRVPKCNGYGSICYDPRFIGGDGVMFYFHGTRNQTYCLVSDPAIHINAQLIGTRPPERRRDFTWISSLGILFAAHTLTATAAAVTLAATPAALWDSPDGSIRIERTAAANSAVIYLSARAEIFITAVPITEEDDRVHGYRIPAGDCFVHLDVQFKFAKLSADVEGVLGKTYRPGYVSPVKIGVPMPVLGGEATYRTTSLISADCAACTAYGSGKDVSTWQEKKVTSVSECSSRFGSGSGIICRR